MIRHDSCPLCLSTEISCFLKCPDYFLSKETFEVFRCSKCGFQFTKEHPGESEAGKYYESEDYISHSDTSKSLTDKAYQLVRKLMLGKKKRTIKKVTGISAGTILDIGCGTGHFLNSMKMAGWAVTGIEINELARKYAETRFGLEVLSPDKINSLHAGSFDCITLWHVLEHFHEPFRVMEEISRLLKPEGVCVIALPNSDSFDAKYYGKEWAAYDVPRHLWHFNPGTFKLFAQKNNFTIRKTKTLPFDVFYISILSEKYKSSGIPFLYGSIKASYFAFKRIFKKSGSSSIIYLLQKG